MYLCVRVWVGHKGRWGAVVELGFPNDHVQLSIQKNLRPTFGAPDRTKQVIFVRVRSVTTGVSGRK